MPLRSERAGGCRAIAREWLPMLALYQFLRPWLLALLRFLQKFFPALQEFLGARNGLLERWRKADLGSERIWFHVSSVGELEQSRPVIEALKGKYSVVLSYFSP